MIDLDRVLVFDASKLGREGLAAVLDGHCSEVLVASEIGAACEIVAAQPDLSLVIAAVELPATDGLHLLGEIAARARDARPYVIVVTSRPLEDHDLRAADLGADGYLSKPILFRDIARVLKSARGGLAKSARRIRSQPVGVALLEDSGRGADGRRESAAHLAWDIHDLSLTGAFIETKGPFDPGHEFVLSLMLGCGQIRVRAKVVRVQAPRWEHVAGVGVEFSAFEAEGSRRLSEYIDRSS